MIRLTSGVIVAAMWLGIPAQQFRGRADFVAVYPLVSSPDGRLVTDLTRDDFVVLDDGKPAEIAVFSSDEQPITAAVMLDMSASMEDRLVRVRDAAMHLVDVVGPNDRLRIGSFGYEISLSPWLTSDKKVLARVLREELWPGGSTPLWNALDAGMKSIVGEPGRRTVIAVTDGIDTNTAGLTQTAIAERATAGLFMLYAIGMEGKELSPRLVNLIVQTGGGYFALRRGDDLGAAFTKLAVELRHQYLVGFAPNTLDGRTHTLEVRVTRPELKVRAPTQFVAVKIK